MHMGSVRVAHSCGHSCIAGFSLSHVSQQSFFGKWELDHSPFWNPKCHQWYSYLDSPFSWPVGSYQLLKKMLPGETDRDKLCIQSPRGASRHREGANTSPTVLKLLDAVVIWWQWLKMPNPGSHPQIFSSNQSPEWQWQWNWKSRVPSRETQTRQHAVHMFFFLFFFLSFFLFFFWFWA